MTSSFNKCGIALGHNEDCSYNEVFISTSRVCYSLECHFQCQLESAGSEFQEQRQQQRRSLIHILCGIVALFSFGNFVVSFHSPGSIEWQRRLRSRNGKSLMASTALIIFVLLLSFQQRTLIKKLSGELTKLNSIRTQNDNFSGWMQ